MIIKKIVKYFKIKFFWITLERFPNLFRPSSKPFISGDTFRNFSDHVFDESNNIDTQKVKKNDVIFLNPDLIEIFFTIYDKKIKNRYILITHNSDRNIGESEVSFMSKNVIHWFAQNLTIPEKDTVTLIPIGLENIRRLKHGRRKWFKNTNLNKTKLILSSFNIFTNYKKRSFLKDAIKNYKFVDSREINSTKEYFSKLNDYMFVVCPEGNGADTHRIWESLLLNTIPIVISTPFTDHLKKNNIPCLYLEKWEDLNNYTEIDLKHAYKELSKENTSQYAKFNFWAKKIAYLK